MHLTKHMNKDFKIIDLTHELNAETITWDGSCGFKLSLNLDYKECTPPYLFRVQDMSSRAGIGTHMDAPAHVIPGGETIEGLLLEDLVSDCVVIDVSAEADEDYMIMPADVEKFEKEHGLISKNSFVIFYTGWSKYWDDKKKFHNNHKYPGVHKSTAELLIKRDISGLGIDTLSPDNGEDEFPVHAVILGAGKYIVENVANADKLPPTGAKSLVLPIKIKDGTEAPIRLIALV